MSPSTLSALEASIRRDLERLDYPKRPWVLPRHARDGRAILDVLIIGGGQSGLAAAFGLQREKVTNLLVVDDSPAGFAGPWKTFARMHTLRTPKHVTGPAQNLPHLGIPVRHDPRSGAFTWLPEERCFAVPVRPSKGEGLEETLLARKVVLAMG